MLPDVVRCSAILYSTAPIQTVGDTDAELLQYWAAISTILREAKSAAALLAAARLVRELQRRKVAFVRSNGQNLRVTLIAPYAKWAYEALDDTPVNASHPPAL
jgi:hypothetical protein